MAVNQLRPYERHMVSNIPNLLAAGQPLSALAVGQLGIFDAKTNLSVTAPTYATNKAIYFAQGTPDHSGFPEGAMIPNMYRTSHIVEGKRLLGLRGKKASRGQGEIVTLGYNGVDTSLTLSAKPGETFYYWIRLTGDPIFNLNPDRAKGVIIQGAVQMPCADECADNCTTVDCNTIVDRILEDYNGHFDNDQQRFVGGKFLPGGRRANQYAQMCKLVSCVDPPSFTTIDYDQFCLVIPDDGSQSALGEVQAQNPGFTITRTDRTGIYSTYCTTVLDGDPAPVAFVQGFGSVIPNCTVCPTGFTSNPALEEFQVRYDGNITGKATVIDNALAAYDPTVVTIVQTDVNTGVTTFKVTTVAGTTLAQVNTALAALLGSTLPGYLDTIFVGTTAPFCSNNGTITYPWTETEDFCHRIQVQFTLSLKDDVCGNTFITQMQAAYATIAVTGGTVPGTVSVNEGRGCVHEYTLTTYSDNCGPANCCSDDVVFPNIPAFMGGVWTPVPLGVGTTCVCGVQLTSNFVRRKETECTFGYWVHQTDWAHIEISSHNPDWRSTDLCETDPIATRIQNGAYPNGEGPMVVRFEKQDRMYDMDYFYLAAHVREAFDYYFEAKFDVYYDMVAVDYTFNYPSNDGFGQTDTDSYTQYFWLPETEATALITALNTYAASVPILVDPLVL